MKALSILTIPLILMAAGAVPKGELHSTDEVTNIDANADITLSELVEFSSEDPSIDVNEQSLRERNAQEVIDSNDVKISRPSPTPPTRRPTPMPTVNNSDGGGSPQKYFTSRMGCPNGSRKVRICINTDKYGDEFSWKFTKRGASNRIILKNSRTYGAFDSECKQVCAGEGQYAVTFFDKIGDGICCAYGKKNAAGQIIQEGNYRIEIENGGQWELLIKGGAFKAKQYEELIQVRLAEPKMQQRALDWLNAHNTRRKYWHRYYKKSYVELKWDEELEEGSRIYAQKLLDTCSDIGIKHDPNNNFGENMSKNRGGRYTWGRLYEADKLVGRYVDREVGLGWPKNFHLTQALWRPSKYVGCGEAVKEFGGGLCRIQVCRYAQTGNCNMTPETWEERMMEDESRCLPYCPNSGCH